MKTTAKQAGRALIILSCIAYALPALAHSGEAAGFSGGITSGFLNPIYGWDHVIAMVAVCLWGAFLAAPAIWN